MCVTCKPRPTPLIVHCGCSDVYMWPVGDPYTLVKTPLKQQQLMFTIVHRSCSDVYVLMIEAEQVRSCQISTSIVSNSRLRASSQSAPSVGHFDMFALMGGWERDMKRALSQALGTPSENFRETHSYLFCLCLSFYFANCMSSCLFLSTILHVGNRHS